MDAQTSPRNLELAAVFAALPDATAVFAADPPLFTVLAASEALLSIAQRPREAVVGRPLAEVFPSTSPGDSRASRLPGLLASVEAAVRTGAPQRMDRQHQEARYWDVVNIPVPRPDGAVHCVLHQIADVTAQVHDEAAAARAERRAERIIERMGDAHCVLDPEFRITRVNAAAERVLGVPRAALVGRSHWEVFPASRDSPVGLALRRAVAEGSEQHLTHHYTGEGYDLHLEVDAYPTDEGGLAMFWRDVTERVRAEAALRASEEKYRALFNGMDEAYAVIEVMADASGRWTDILFLEVNPAFMRHTGMPYPVGRTANQLLGSPNPRWAELYGRVAQTGESLRLEESEFTLGRVFDLSVFQLGGAGSRRVAVLFTDITERRRAEEAVRESERRFRLLFENMGEGFALAEMIWDEDGRPADWRYLEVNDAWAQTGVPVSQTVGRTAREVNPELEPDWIETYGRVVRTGRPITHENYMKGFGRWFDTVAFKHSENRFGLIFRDVTERKQAEAERRASAERQAFLLKLGDVLRPLASATEIQQAAARILGEHLGANRAFYAEVEGEDWRVANTYEREAPPQAQGRHPMAQFGQWTIDGFQAGAHLVIRDLDADTRLTPSQRATYTAYRILGAVAVPLVKEGALVAVLAVHTAAPHDWSEQEIALVEETAERTWEAVGRARTEEALRGSEGRFRMLADNIAQLAWTSDTLGNVTWYNQRWLDYTGLSFEDMKGGDWSKVLHPGHLKRVLAGIQHSDATGEPWTDTFPLRGGDGQYRWFLSRAIPIHGERGDIVRWFGTNTDVTELREANRAKDEFLAMLGHELRNPLAPIVSTLELMGLEGGRKFSKEREMMVRQARHLAALLDDLLDASRMARGKVELERKTLALDELVDRAVEAAGPLLEQRRHRLSVDVAPGLWVSADEKRLVQVLSNLLTNAAHYTPPGGHVRLTGQRDGRSVVLRVRDDGVGISAELLPRVFERFQQGPRTQDRSEGGLGLGLAIVRSLVQLHGGTVTAASEGVGKGSEFEVRLPAARARRAPAPRAKPAEGPSAAPAPGQRILLVDDNRAIADALCLLLSKSGHTVDKAYDGLTALAVAARLQPTLAILDIGLPDMSGYELARRLRKQKGFAEGKLVALTGYGAKADRLRSKRAGFAEHLAKPIELEDLLATIARITTPSAPRKSPRRRRE